MHNRSMILTLCAAAGLLLQGQVLAWPGEGCRFKAERQQQIALDGAGLQGVRKVIVRAGAGDLIVHGIKNGTIVKAHGKACAPSEALLAGTNVSVTREGDAVIVASVLPPKPKPEVSILWSGASPYVDIDVELPAELAITLDDTSGDTRIFNIAGGSVRDSSGDLEIHGVSGDLDVLDGSGDLLVEDVGGRLSLDDSSGDIVIRNVKGNILVRNDSSGDIRISNAGANVTIGNDSSGDIDVQDVAGDFTLEAKGSGDVSVHGVKGKVKIPDYKQ